MRVDYWVCPYCGTHYGAEDEICSDPKCEDRLEQDLKDSDDESEARDKWVYDDEISDE